jgi:hypothetical protein
VRVGSGPVVVVSALILGGEDGVYRAAAAELGEVAKAFAGWCVLMGEDV